MRNEEQDHLDMLLDEALSRYAGCEPRPGLEERVLAGVYAASARRRFPRWLAAVPALLGVLVSIAVWKPYSPMPAPAPGRPVVPSIRLETSARIYKVKRPARSGNERPPKQPRFPMPTPLTNQERALLMLLAQAPDEAREVLSVSTQLSPPVLRITEIPTVSLNGNDSLQ
jgi:hypothetical protein